MNLTIILFLSFFPILLISIFIYTKDKNKEPIRLLLTFFILGILSCFITLFLSKVFAKFLPFMRMNKQEMSFIDIFLYSFIGIALLEEICKWVIAFYKGYKNKEFEETYDIIIYSVFIALGFSFCENCFYIINNDIQILSILLRGLSSVPGHVCDGIFMGYYLSMARQFKYQDNKKLEMQNIALSILIPTILHGIYDFCIISNSKILIITFLAFIIFIYIISIKKLKMLSKYNHKLMPDITFCKVCGAKMKDSHCQNCNDINKIYKKGEK